VNTIDIRFAAVQGNELLTTAATRRIRVNL
jgi:hypothetical protein